MFRCLKEISFRDIFQCPDCPPFVKRYTNTYILSLILFPQSVKDANFCEMKIVQKQNSLKKKVKLYSVHNYRKML